MTRTLILISRRELHATGLANAHAKARTHQPGNCWLSTLNGAHHMRWKHKKQLSLLNHGVLMDDKGLFKKKCQLSCSFVFCLSLLLFYSEMVHKQWLKVWFLISQMPILSGRINFVPFSTTSNFCFPKIPMKYSKNGQKFAMSKNPSNMLFNTCWTPCKKPHVSTRSRSWYTFFLITPYLLYLLNFPANLDILFIPNIINIKVVQPGQVFH